MRRVPGVDHLAVVVPARDEADLLPDCLASVDRAQRLIRRRWPGVSTRVVVVLDSWTTDPDVATRIVRGVDSITVAHGSVGPSRAAGVEWVRNSLRADPRHVWVANTDADTVVPEDWLDRQLDFAARGVGLVIGSAAPDHRRVAPGLLRAWLDRHHLVEDHSHVFGANLGFRLAAYDLVGGFEPVDREEDVRLVARLRAAGVPWRATTTTHVTTSGRRLGRAPGGFAGYLDALAEVPLNESGDDLERNPA